MKRTSRSGYLGLLGVPLALVAGCSLSTSNLVGGGTSNASNAPNQPRPTGQVTVPNLFGMQKDDAIAELRRAGHSGEVSWDPSHCSSVHEGRIIEIGEVCSQSPGAGNTTSAQLPIRLTVQKKDPRHGNIGTHTEWHLMPDLVGMPLEQARTVMRDHGFTAEDRIELIFVTEKGCAPLTVCRTMPEALSRHAVTTDMGIFVGADPDARQPENDASEAEPAGTKPPAELEPQPFF